jgi:hypothetical protein
MAAAIKFYTDEHISKAIIRGLRQRGIDVQSVPEAGMKGATDEEHLERARVEGRVIVTYGPDFLRLSPCIPDHAGIAYASDKTPMRRIIDGLVLIHQVLEPADMIGRVEFL